GALRRRPLGEKHHRANGAVACDRQIRQQQIALRLTCVLDRRHYTDVQLADAHPPVEFGGYTVDELGIELDDATIDRAVDRIAVDVRNASDFHQAATAGLRSNTRRTL